MNERGGAKQDSCRLVDLAGSALPAVLGRFRQGGLPQTTATSPSPNNRYKWKRLKLTPEMLEALKPLHYETKDLMCRRPRFRQCFRRLSIDAAMSADPRAQYNACEQMLRWIQGATNAFRDYATVGRTWRVRSHTRLRVMRLPRQTSSHGAQGPSPHHSGEAAGTATTTSPGPYRSFHA